MKSQDIVLLLKLVSLSQRESEVPSQEPENWKGWDEGTAHRQSLLHAYGTDVFSEELDDHEDQFMISSISMESDSFDLGTHDPYSVRALSFSTGISKSEVSIALKRCYANGLARRERHSGIPRANTKYLYEFIVYGLRYVFPVKPGEVTRGIATGLAAPVLQGELMTSGDLVPVWPDARGNAKGIAVDPLFKTVPMAVRRDSTLYAFLALIDAIRMGQPRERNFSAKKLEILLKG